VPDACIVAQVILLGNFWRIDSTNGRPLSKIVGSKTAGWRAWSGSPNTQMDVRRIDARCGTIRREEKYSSLGRSVHSPMSSRVE
jgi:hypothetical protein